MQFQVPQFIDIENKIVGPLSLRQFLYIAGGGGISVLFFFLDIFKLWSWVILSAVFIGIGAALAWGKWPGTGQPIPKVLPRVFSFFIKPRLYLWRREALETVVKVPDKEISFNSAQTAMEKRKNLKEYFPDMPSVKNLMLNLMTTKSPIPKREKQHLLNWGQVPKEKFEVLKKITGEKEMARRVDYR